MRAQSSRPLIPLALPRWGAIRAIWPALVVKLVFFVALVAVLHVFLVRPMAARRAFRPRVRRGAAAALFEWPGAGPLGHEEVGRHGVSRSAIADVDPNWISTKPTQSQDTEVCGDLDLDLDLSLSLDLASAALALGVGTADVSVHPTAPP